MSSWAKPGVKCVCVDGKPRYGSKYSVLPVEGKVYTIASVEYCRWTSTEGMGVHLAELQRPVSIKHGRALPFTIDRFRPLITRTQEDDVALFRDLLTDVSVGVDA